MVYECSNKYLSTYYTSEKQKFCKFCYNIVTLEA